MLTQPIPGRRKLSWRGMRQNWLRMILWSERVSGRSEYGSVMENVRKVISQARNPLTLKQIREKLGVSSVGRQCAVLAERGVIRIVQKDGSKLYSRIEKKAARKTKAAKKTAAPRKSKDQSQQNEEAST